MRDDESRRIVSETTNPLGGDGPALGLAITTIGRPEIAELLRSAARSSNPPAAVAIANQSGRDLNLDRRDLPFPVSEVPSEGGISAGRNDAVRALPEHVSVLAFPNDDGRYPGESLKQVVQCFRAGELDAVAGSLLDQGRPRLVLPPSGTPLDRITVWRAIEPALFVRRNAFDAVGGFRLDLGSGAPTPWQSGEGTDLLLRLLERGGCVTSRPEITVLGRGERRSLTDSAWVAKHRGYARGTGYVYRLHAYPLYVRWRIVAGPWRRPNSHAQSMRLSWRLAMARSLGRVEGLLGRPLLDRSSGPED